AMTMGVAPTVYALTAPSALGAYSPMADNFASMFYGNGYFDAGYAGAGYYGGAPYYAGPFYGASYFGAWPAATGYFYTFAPPAVLYRDITTTPLGKTVRQAPG